MKKILIMILMILAITSISVAADGGVLCLTESDYTETIIAGEYIPVTSILYFLI